MLSKRLSPRQLFLHYVGQTSEEPMAVEIERAEGVWQFGPDGKKYLDLISGIAVSSLGHADPDVLKAVHTQVDNYLHSMVYGEFLLSPQFQFATRIVEVLDSKLDNVFFVNSGSEAIEGALKLAKKYTGRTRLVACNKSYHGSTHGALSVTGSAYMKQGFGPFLPGVDFVEFNDPEGLEKITEQTAAFVVECIQGEAGVRIPDPAYMTALRKKCDETGTLLIMDECQTGFGRTGKMFAHQSFGLVPDILTLGKSLGGGMPLGAFIANKSVMQVLTHDPVLGHITTFGGHPVSCAAGLAALEKIISLSLVDRAAQMESRVREELAEGPFLEIRGKGLMFAACLGSFEKVKKTISNCVEAGIITDWFLHCDDSVRIAPPLTITGEELDYGLRGLIQAAKNS